MSYDVARQAFEENKALIGDPANNPEMWNLCNGLRNLVSALQSDIAVLRHQVVMLTQVVEALKHQRK